MGEKKENALENIIKLNKDLKEASEKLSDKEVRYMVDTYYKIQEHRIAMSAQIRELEKSGEPCEVLKWLSQNTKILENEIKKTLKYYVESSKIGNWLISITGIGPVIGAGLLAHIDITKAPTAGNIWSFAGLNPDMKWEKGKRRPHNAQLKSLCWIIGKSFVKVSNHEKDIYGKIYKDRKELEMKRNDNFEYANQAKTKLEKFKIGKETKAYESYSKGQLPLGHIQQRAERYAVKIFLSHLHEVWYRDHYNEAPPKPFAIEHLGHAHIIEAPI